MGGSVAPAPSADQAIAQVDRDTARLARIASGHSNCAVIAAVSVSFRRNNQIGCAFGIWSDLPVTNRTVIKPGCGGWDWLPARPSGCQKYQYVTLMIAIARDA